MYKLINYQIQQNLSSHRAAYCVNNCIKFFKIRYCPFKVRKKLIVPNKPTNCKCTLRIPGEMDLSTTFQCSTFQFQWILDSVRFESLAGVSQLELRNNYQKLLRRLFVKLLDTTQYPVG